MEVLISSPKKLFSAMDIVNEVYIDTPKNLYPAAAANVEHHLLKLLKENKVKQIGSQFQYINPSKI